MLRAPDVESTARQKNKKKYLQTIASPENFYVFWKRFRKNRI